MAKYINADELLAKLTFKVNVDKEVIRLGTIDDVSEFKLEGEVEGCMQIIRCVKHFPPADVAEVKHAHWIDKDGKAWCNLCGKPNKAYKPPYCPFCGARMDGEKND